MNDRFAIYENLKTRRTSVAVIGLGYVGRPVAEAFARHFDVVAYDISQERINHIKSSSPVKHDTVHFTSDANDLDKASLYIITVGTPVDELKRPDLSQLISVTKTVAGHLHHGDYVVYESTVYPGCTDSICIPLLEELSGIKCGADFKVGYSPERINPVDTEHTFRNTVKIVSGVDHDTSTMLQKIYRHVIQADVVCASGIRVAEASKIVENTQRCVNIALMNEMSRLFSQMDINFSEVFDMASTKWNFVDYRPGLVGGHCIPVDPYYLIAESARLGLDAPLTKSSCSVNDGMADYIVRSLLSILNSRTSCAPHKVLIMGFTYKANSDDIRNPAVAEMYAIFTAAGLSVDIIDPHADVASVKGTFGIELSAVPSPLYDLIIVTIGHDEYLELDENYFIGIARRDAILADIKGIYRNRISKIGYWTL